MEVSNLRASRRAHRAHLTRIYGKIATILESDETPNERNTATLQTSLEQIEAKRTTILELDTSIRATIEDESALESEILDSEEIMFTIAEKIAFIRAVLARPRQPSVETPPLPDSVPTSELVIPPTTPATPPPSDHSVSEDPPVPIAPLTRSSSTDRPEGHITPASISQNASRLPKLTLPRFGGDPLKWQTFWDSFESAVHSNTVLTNVQKLNYLRVHLEGEAARAVAGFSLTSVNYDQSLEVLRNRFGDQQKIINAHMHALMNLPNASNNITSLKTLYDVIENHVRGLAALGQSAESYGALLVPMILGKLPVDVRKNLAREHDNLEWTLDQLQDSIVKEIRVIEAGTFLQSPQPEDYHCPTASFHTGTMNRTENRKPPKCVFCKGSHPATQCNTITDQSKRMDIVKREKLCFNCLGHHRVSQCQSNGRCKRCKERHHTSLCRGTTNSQISSNSQKPPLEQSPAPSHTAINTALSHPQICFLKTAVAKVRVNSYSAQVNVLLDEGAQRSFITQSLADSLHLSSQRKECVAIAAFGATEASKQTLPVATIHLETTDGTEIPISVLITPRIAQPLHNFPFPYVKQLPYLKDLQLNHAISDSNDINISMLIGADAYWSIVQEAVVRGPGPTAVQSKLGYLLSGPLYDYRTPMSSGVFHLTSVSLLNSPDVTPSGDVWQTDLVQSKQSSTFLQEYLCDSVTRQSDGTYLVKFP